MRILFFNLIFASRKTAMNTTDLISKTIFFVKQQLKDSEGGHDWFHIERVYKNALLIANEETCDLTVVKLAALLHDIADSKFNDGDDRQRG